MKVDYASKDFFIGAIINILSRQIKIVDFADQFTRSNFESKTQKTYAMIKPDAVQNMGQIISKIEQSSLAIERLKLFKFSTQKAEEFYGEHKGKNFFENLVKFMTSGYVVGMELVGNDAVAVWRALIGPTNSHTARMEKPDSVRALFGTDGSKNAVHGSDSTTSADRELKIFDTVDQTTDFFERKSSFILIKPHVLREQKMGQVLATLIPKLGKEGISIINAELFKLTRANSEEFLEVYRDVIPEFHQIAEELTEGKCLALAVQGEAFVVQTVRKIIGPHDPQVSRALRENTIRAQFGKDKVRNAVHCTDLEDDGELECEFFFLLLKK